MKARKTTGKSSGTFDSAENFIYNAFFRDQPPSILRLAILQLHKEGVAFEAKNYKKIMLMILDRADSIVRKIRASSAKKQLHKDIINLRIPE